MKRLIRSILVLATLSASALLLTSARSQSQTAPAKASYLGAQVCAACHSELVERMQKSMLSRAMEPAAECRILREHPKMKFQNGRFTYEITREGNQSIYTISDALSRISVPILYGFGQGKSGQTYVYRYKGAMYESRVSFYREIDGLDITLGYSRDPEMTLEDAAGRKLSLDETQRCFSCHSTGSPVGADLQLDHLVPGVNCESCHGPGQKHVAALRAGDAAGARMKRFGESDGDDINQIVCGRCHRSVGDVMDLPKRGSVHNVRFQPYRMFNSRCYSADRRISCTACHDPHGPLEATAGYYDAKCLACHRSSQAGAAAENARKEGKACPVGKPNCTNCHMPKVELPGAHFKFTDHRIRIARDGSPYPI